MSGLWDVVVSIEPHKVVIRAKFEHLVRLNVDQVPQTHLIEAQAKGNSRDLAPEPTQTQCVTHDIAIVSTAKG